MSVIFFIKLWRKPVLKLKISAPITSTATTARRDHVLYQSPITTKAAASPASAPWDWAKTIAKKNKKTKKQKNNISAVLIFLFGVLKLKNQPVSITNIGPKYNPSAFG